MKTIAALTLLLLASQGFAEEGLARHVWDPAAARPGMRVLPPSAEAAFAQLEVSPEPGVPSRLLTIERPKITSARYALRGRVRYEGVEGEGYLEMWNQFPNGGRFFSRSL